MTDTITRNMALACTAALPPTAEPDPAVVAYGEWRAAFADYSAKLKASKKDDDPEVEAAAKIEEAAALRMAETVASTPAGMLAQISFAHYVFGDVAQGGSHLNVADYRFGVHWFDIREAAVMRSLLAAAERMAGAA